MTRLFEVVELESQTCAIPYCDVGAMLERVSDTAKDDRERAISFCGDGNELSFPSVTGRPTGVVPTCPPGKKHIGDFHTHTLSAYPPGLLSPEKSMRDWNDDFQYRKRVSCVGTPEIDFLEGVPVIQRTIVCHMFKTDDPEYEALRKRFLTASSNAALYEKKIATTLKSRKLTPEEHRYYQAFKNELNALLEEGISKGIIRGCCPYSRADKFAVPDVEGMLAEQKD